MNRPLICMTLTGKTLEEDKKLVKKYEKQIDMVELRVDHLTEDEQLYVKRFPSLINLPENFRGLRFLDEHLLLPILINQKILLM